MGIISLDHQPEHDAGLAQTGFQRIRRGLPLGTIGHDGAKPIVRRQQNKLPVRGRAIEHLTRRPVQESGAGLFRHGRQAGAPGPCPQR